MGGQAQMELWGSQASRKEPARAKARSVQEQTGWKRSSPLALCMVPEVLSRITEHDYDLQDAGFVEYFRSRTGYRLRDVEQEWSEVLARLASPAAPVTDRAWALTRAKLQDCWEVFCWRRNQKAESGKRGLAA